MTVDNSKVIASAMQSKTEIFIQKAIRVHGNKYDYSLTRYIGSKDKVIIKCPIHGEFQQRPNCHLAGKGCLSCSGRENLTTKDFVNKATLIHKAYYDYSRTIYKNRRTNVEIICPKHGIFEQNPGHHLHGNGCNQCAYELKAQKLSRGNEGFIKLAREVHGDRYLYDKCKYANSKKAVIITCRVHGDFTQKPEHHIRKKSGCPKCVVRHFQRDSYLKIACKHKGESKLYVLRCFEGDEVFYKVGVSVNGVSGRYRTNQEMPYQYEILREVVFDAGLAWDLEKQAHRLLKKFKYCPKIYFAGGKTECFSVMPRKIINLIDRLKDSSQLVLIT